MKYDITVVVKAYIEVDTWNIEADTEKEAIKKAKQYAKDNYMREWSVADADIKDMQIDNLIEVGGDDE